MNKMRLAIWGLVVTFLVMFGGWAFVKTLVGHNHMYSWQFIQSWDGTVTVNNGFGWYYKGFATVTTYPDVIEIYGRKGEKGDDSAKVSFNDGGYATEEWYARVVTPKVYEELTPEAIEKMELLQRDFHRLYGNAENAKIAVRSHVRDCIGRTGQIMSSSENQAHRKAEFYEVSFEQVRDGYLQMRPVVIRRKGGVSDIMKAVASETAAPAGDTTKTADKDKTSTGISIAQAEMVVVGEESVEASDTVKAAEVVRDPKTGKPIVETPSPLIQAGFKVIQYSISKTEYDPDTQAKFQAKRDLLLKSESSRAQTVRYAQERLGNIALSNKAIAETEATANQEAAKKIITAQALQEVEGVRKKLMEVQGQTKVLTAGVLNKKLTAEQATAVFAAKTAENAKLAAETIAKAKEQMIGIGGAVTDAEEQLQTIYTEQVEAVSKSVAGLKVPKTVIIPMEIVPDGQNPLTYALPSLQILEAMGLNDKLTDEVMSTWKPSVKVELPTIKLELPPTAVTPDPAPKAEAPVTDSAPAPVATP